MGGAVLVLAVTTLVLLVKLKGPGSAQASNTTPTSEAATSTTATTLPLLTPTVTSCDQSVGQLGGKPTFATAPVMMINPAKSYRAVIATTTGTITVQLSPTIAPQAVNSFVFLARCGYYDNTVVEIVTGDVLVAGDPTGTLTDSAPGYVIPDEPPPQPGYAVGSVVLFNQGPNTGGGTFFVVARSPANPLPPQFSLFGQVIAGLDVAQRIASAETSENGRPADTITLTKVTIEES